MDKIQKMQKAKSYLEMLANKIDPTSQIECDDPILENETIRKCFLYVSSILDDLIKNGGEIIQVIEPIDFKQDLISKDKIRISDTPVSILTIANNINRQVDDSIMKKLSSSVIKNWLISSGYLTTENVKVVRNISELRITDKSQTFGIIEKEVINQRTGEIKPTVMLKKEAQEYIIENLEEIVLSQKKSIYNTETIEI